MPQLFAVMYHYVRDLIRTPFPRIKGFTCDEFCAQVDWLGDQFEMATLESAMAFLRHEYKPRRDLCLLTFDDALKDHVANVLPVLSERKVQGIFGIITACVEERTVARVHMNHFLTAALEFNEYRNRLSAKLDELAPGLTETFRIDSNEAQRSYPLDTLEAARFKFLVNFVAPRDICGRAMRDLFVESLGSERAFAEALYMNWTDIRELQRHGMAIAGHTHQHLPLSSLSPADLRNDIQACRALLDRNIAPQSVFAFSYPYGKCNSYSRAAIEELNAAGFDCAFDTEFGSNTPGCNVYAIHRVDCNGAAADLQKLQNSVQLHVA